MYNVGEEEKGTRILIVGTGEARLGKAGRVLNGGTSSGTSKYPTMQSAKGSDQVELEFEDKKRKGLAGIEFLFLDLTCVSKELSFWSACVA
jgi:hypothetical protein